MLGFAIHVAFPADGQLGLFGVAPTYMPQIDQHLGDLVAIEV